MTEELIVGCDPQIIQFDDRPDQLAIRYQKVEQPPGGKPRRTGKYALFGLTTRDAMILLAQLHALAIHRNLKFEVDVPVHHVPPKKDRN